MKAMRCLNFVLAVALGATAACGEAGRASNAAFAQVRDANDAATTPALAGGCASALRVELDRASFIDGVEAADTLRDRTGARVIGTANRLCRDGRIPPAALAPFRVLLVQYAAGADSSAFYVDDEEGDPATLIFQSTFAEGAPTSEDIEGGLICWQTPEDEACAERLP